MKNSRIVDFARYIQTVLLSFIVLVDISVYVVFFSFFLQILDPISSRISWRARIHAEARSHSTWEIQAEGVENIKNAGTILERRFKWCWLCKMERYVQSSSNFCKLLLFRRIWSHRYPWNEVDEMLIVGWSCIKGTEAEESFNALNFVNFRILENSEIWKEIRNSEKKMKIGISVLYARISLLFFCRI